MNPRPGSPLLLPTSGPDPWVARVTLRRTGAPGELLLPGLRGREVELMRVTLTPEAVDRLGGPAMIPAALEPDRRKLVRGAFAQGYRGGWAVEVDVERGYRRSLWPVSVEGAAT